MYTCSVLLILVTIVAGLSAEEALQEFANAQLEFTVDVCKEQLQTETSNTVVSTLSAYIILALLTEGSACSTAQELRKGLSLPNKNTTEAAIKFLMVSFNARTDDSVTVSLANKIYLAESFQIKRNFERIATTDYGADVQGVNFTNSLKTANLINQWVENRTNNRIQNLISPNQLTAATRLILVNALYFNGNWTTQFPPHRTTKGTFYPSNNSSVQIDFMHSADSAQYGFFHCGYLGASFLEMSYKGSNYSMNIILPDKRDGLPQVVANLKDYLNQHKYKMETVEVVLPKFSITSSTDFKPILEEMGINRVFDPTKADLSGISNERGLYVDFVLQKAFINVTETGTEAAAATAVGVGTTFVPPPPKERFIADHPFIFHIKDNYSGTILFIGRFNK